MYFPLRKSTLLPAFVALLLVTALTKSSVATAIVNARQNLGPTNLSSETTFYTRKISLVWPINGLTLQLSYNRHSDTVLMTFSNACYFGTRFQPGEKLQLIADGKIVFIETPVSFDHTGICRQESQNITYRLPLETYKKIASASSIQGVIGNEHFRLNHNQVNAFRELESRLPNTP